MDNWEGVLKEKIGNMIESRRITNFMDVKDFFERRFKSLTNIVGEDVGDLTGVQEDEGIARFRIYNYDLTLENKNDEIWILKGDPDKSIIFGNISFENGFAVIKVQNKKHFLSTKSVNTLFKEAFSELLN